MDELQVGQFTVRREQSSNRNSMKAINGRCTLRRERGSAASEALVGGGREVAFTVDDDGGALDPLGAVLRHPVASGPFADVVAAGEDARPLDVADFHDVLVLREHVAQLLAGGAVAHGAVDVFQNLGGVSGAVAQELFDLLSDSGCFHRRYLLSILCGSSKECAVVLQERGRSYNRCSNLGLLVTVHDRNQVFFLHLRWIL